VAVVQHLLGLERFNMMRFNGMHIQHNSHPPPFGSYHGRGAKLYQMSMTYTIGTYHAEYTQ
jgi:hypothetical protein